MKPDMIYIHWFLVMRTVHNLEDIGLATDQLKNGFKIENTLRPQQMVALYLWLQQTSWEWCNYAQIMPNAYVLIMLSFMPASIASKPYYTSYILCWPITEHSAALSSHPGPRPSSGLGITTRSTMLIRHSDWPDRSMTSFKVKGRLLPIWLPDQERTLRLQ